MSVALVRAASMRRTETPNAVMTTLASPTQGPSAGLSTWKVVMTAGQHGPLHVFDQEQVWHVLTGSADFTVGDETARLAAGDAIALPGGVTRQVTAVTAAEFVVCGQGDAVVTVVGEDQPRGTPAWIS